MTCRHLKTTTDYRSLNHYRNRNCKREISKFIIVGQSKEGTKRGESERKKNRKVERLKVKIAINFLLEISLNQTQPKLSKRNSTFIQISVNLFFLHSSKIHELHSPNTRSRPKPIVYKNPKLNHQGEGHSSELDCLDQCL